MNTLTLRVSNNVLPRDDFPVFSVKVQQGMVVARDPEAPGLLQFGSPVEAIQHWLAYDPTGTHPEEYQEVYDPRTEEWRSGLSLEELQDLLSSMPVH